ncbi:HD domain-containing protein [Candidatus Saccharibacteria bacterium]|nr:HD domain-containing protein [Candidatus Saccharibacteria bacterium]
MTPPPAKLLNLQKLINDFSRIRRSVYMPGLDEDESDLHHSASVAFLAWQIYEDLNLDLDLGKILKYALAHDIVEIYAGDINAYASPELRAEKKRREAKSLARIEKEMKVDFPDLVAIMRDYEARSDDEALFVWSVDKMQVLIQGRLDYCRSYYEQGILLEQVRQVHGKQVENASPLVKDLYKQVFDWFVADYDETKAASNGKIRNNPPAR